MYSDTWLALKKKKKLRVLFEASDKLQPNLNISLVKLVRFVAYNAEVSKTRVKWYIWYQRIIPLIYYSKNAAGGSRLITPYKYETREVG